MPNKKNHTRNISPELQLLIACCQVQPDLDEIGRLLKNEQFKIQNGDKLISLAAHHGVLPLVYQTLKNLSTYYQPSTLTINQRLEQLLPAFKQQYLYITQKNMLMSAELLRIMKLFESNSIEALAFKGPVLAQVAYGDITLRQYGDLDILVKRKQFRRIAESLQLQGFIPHFPISDYKEDKVLFDMNNDCPFYDKKRGIAIELHWDFFRKLALPTEKFYPWEKKQSVTINGYPIRTLSHESHLLYHSLHGSKHVWERFIWIVDIDRFIRAVPNIDWDRMLRMAREMGAQKMFLFGIALAHRYFETPLPDNIRTLCHHAQLEPFISYVEAEFNSSNPAPEDSLVKWSKVIGLRDNLYYKVATILEFLFRPGINERRTVILPDSLFWLYWPLRPFGMGFRFLFCRLLKLCGIKE